VLEEKKKNKPPKKYFRKDLKKKDHDNFQAKNALKRFFKTKQKSLPLFCFQNKEHGSHFWLRKLVAFKGERLVISEKILRCIFQVQKIHIWKETKKQRETKQKKEKKEFSCVVFQT